MDHGTSSRNCHIPLTPEDVSMKSDEVSGKISGRRHSQNRSYMQKSTSPLVVLTKQQNKI